MNKEDLVIGEKYRIHFVSEYEPDTSYSGSAIYVGGDADNATYLNFLVNDNLFSDEEIKNLLRLENRQDLEANENFSTFYIEDVVCGLPKESKNG